MEQSEQLYKNKFLYPCDRYHGEFTPENLVLNANIQEFTQRVSYIYNLQNGGKLTPQEAYNRIEALWKQLERTKKQLGIGKRPLQNEEGSD